jgi:hypothetical protein
MEKVFAGVLANVAGPEVVRTVRSILNFIYYAHFERHSDHTLAKLHEAWYEFHDSKKVFVDLGIRKHFNIPKVHSMQHYLNAIRSFGTADGYSTEGTERLHIDYAKLGYRASNHKTYIAQMARWLARQEAVSQFSAYLQWAIPGYIAAIPDEVSDEEFEDEEEAPNNLEPQDNLDSESDDEADEDMQRPEITTLQNVPLYTIAKKPGYGSLPVHILERDFGVSNFARHVHDFIRQNLPRQPLPSVNYIQHMHFPVFKKFCLFLSPAPEVTPAVIPDPVRTT